MNNLIMSKYFFIYILIWVVSFIMYNNNNNNLNIIFSKKFNKIKSNEYSHILTRDEFWKSLPTKNNGIKESIRARQMDYIITLTYYHSLYNTLRCITKKQILRAITFIERPKSNSKAMTVKSCIPVKDKGILKCGMYSLKYRNILKK